MSTQKYIDKMTGFKATDANMVCSGNINGIKYHHQFELGVWYEIDGEIGLCKSGFHFCVQPSGPSCYYNQSDSRMFKIEAEQILEVETQAGADFKLVAKRIRLVEEITPGKVGNDKSNTGNRNTGYSNTGNSNTGNRNTGDRNTGNSNTGNSNTGDRNTGNSNTGYSNTGNRNTGDSNTGDRNTGYSNTGYSNTGNSNTGNSNTGNRNTGDRNTGYSNTGYSNTGNRNTGNSNTGYSNTTNNSAGFFCAKEPKVISFDKQTRLTRDQFTAEFPEYHRLGELLLKTDAIDFEPFKRIPGITPAKLKALHKKHLTARKLISK